MEELWAQVVVVVEGLGLCLSAWRKLEGGEVPPGAGGIGEGEAVARRRAQGDRETEGGGVSGQAS